MKKILLATFCAATVLFSGFNVNAMPPHHGQGLGNKMMKDGGCPFAKDLDLTAEQREEAKKIHASGREKMKPIMEEMKGLHEKMEKVREENMKEFEKILTPEQKEKFEKKKAERKEFKKDWKQKRGGGCKGMLEDKPCGCEGMKDGKPCEGCKKGKK